MTNCTRTITLITLLALAAGTAAAQPAGPPPGAPPAAGRITGTVVNAGTRQPIGAAAVAVRGGRDSALVGGGYTRADGTFRIDGLRPGSYSVRVRVIGYAPVVKAGLVVSAAAPVVDAGILTLAPSATELSSVTVTAQQEQVVLAPDRNTYAVKDMPATSGGTVVDVLRNVPAVEVDGDNKVSLRGNQNVVVQINGRITPMRGEQLGAFLAQLPANMVGRVEVVPNPSAKNDPEGMAGIVNIVLKENADLGVSGGATVGGGTTGQVNASGNLGFQAGALTLFGNYGFMRDERVVSGFTDRRGLSSALLPYLESDVTGANSPRSHSLNASAEYRFDTRGALSSDLIVSKRDFTRQNDNVYRELDASRALTAQYLRASAQANDDLTLDWAVAYKRAGARQGDGLSTEFRVNRTGGTADLRLTDETLAIAPTAALAGALLATAVETNATDELTRNWTLQSDYTRTFGARTKLETGYKGQLRQMDNAFGVARLDAATGLFADDAARSNAFDYDEQVHAAYAVLSRGVGRLDLQAGLRAEQVVTRFDLATTGERFDNDYRSIYPSALAAFALDETRQLKASYSKRVSRPDTRQLNPFGFREDALNVFRGNPGLRPEYTHAFELGYQQGFGRGSLQVTPFARHTVNAVRFIRTIDDAGVSTTTFQNVATSDSYGADVNASLRLGRLTGFGGMSMFRQLTDGSNLATDVSNSALGWSARANATFKLTPTTDLQGFLMYRAPMTTEQGRMSAMTMTNVAIRQKLRGERSTLTLRVMDPFNTMGMGFVTDDGRFHQTSERRFGARGAFLSFNYAFGQQPRLRPRASEPQADASQAPGQIP